MDQDEGGEKNLEHTFNSRVDLDSRHKLLNGFESLEDAQGFEKVEDFKKLIETRESGQSEKLVDVVLSEPIVLLGIGQSLQRDQCEEVNEKP